MVDVYLEMLMNSVHSVQTQRQYARTFGLFLRFTGLKNGREVVSLEPKRLTELVIEYVLHLKNTISPNSLPTYMYSVISFCEINDVELKWKKIKKFYPPKVKLSGDAAYSTDDVRKMLATQSKLVNRALIHFVASTACRAGAVLDETPNRPMCMGDLRDMPHGCQMVTIYTDSVQEYPAFLTPEAATALSDYHKERKSNGEIFTQDTPVFVDKLGNPMNYDSVFSILSISAKNANVRGKIKNGRYPVQTCHGFRKRFNIIMKLDGKVADSVVEKAMGHMDGVKGRYFPITDERLFEEFYNKGVPELTVDSTARDQIKIQELEQTNSEVNLEMIESLQEQIHTLTGQTNPKDFTTDFKKTLKVLESTKQLEEIPLEEQMKSLSVKQKDSLLVQLVKQLS
jgi:integrase